MLPFEEQFPSLIGTKHWMIGDLACDCCPKAGIHVDSVRENCLDKQIVRKALDNIDDAHERNRLLRGLGFETEKLQCCRDEELGL